ncbi:hypothetical protein H6G50_04275 [Oscillatoria sp. FACHB-1406]|nr:hypothetical protein [Oscillatoria sp. FACHB-1406]
MLVSTTLVSPTFIDSVKAKALVASEIKMTNKEGHHGDSEHSHGMRDIPHGQPVPRVDLIVHPDEKIGWNLEIRLENFRFAPERVNIDSSTVEGHAHLFVNGQKVTRLYSNWYYLPELPSGRNEIKVSLNTNQHEMLMHDGKEIAATAIINVP